MLTLKTIYAIIKPKKEGVNMKVVNVKIKELRESLNLSQEEFGKSIGLSKSGISNIESGNRGVRESYIELICTKYNVSKVWLTDGSELAKEVHHLESFIEYLKSLNYSVQPIPCSETSCVYEVQSKDYTAEFTQEEFESLQNRNKDAIEGMILLQCQKNKKEPPSAATENGSGVENHDNK